MDSLQKKLLAEISGLHEIPVGAYNIRQNGQSVMRNSTSDIEIIPKTNKSGIDIIVKSNVKNKSVHIPVIITQGGIKDLVYNDFYIGKNSSVTIIAGCGIHNDTSLSSQHDGVHRFHLAENSSVVYIEKHLGIGKGIGGKILNPVTTIDLKKNSSCTMETIQIGGVSSSKRKTSAKLAEGSSLVVKEKILTSDSQTADTQFKLTLSGVNSKADISSRSVARDSSKQSFVSNVIGKSSCFAHVSCDGIVIDNAQIKSTPKIDCQSTEATLVHEAMIGKIAGEQVVKLMTLGLDEASAEELIIKGFLN